MPGRAERLLERLQALRAHRRPVAATRLAEELGVSVRRSAPARSRATRTRNWRSRPNAPRRATRRSMARAWGAKGVEIALPNRTDFGLHFVALDPDGYRLRVFAPAD